MKKRIGYMLFGAISILYITPLIIIFTNSFMSSGKVTFSNYAKLLFSSPVYLHMFWNSVKITVPVVIGQIIVSTLAAYAFSVLRFKGIEILYFLYIIVMLLPLQATLVPNYLVAGWFHMTDSPIAVILPGIFNPFGVFLLRQYMKNMPDAYIEAAKIDGAGHGRILISIMMPMIRPGIAVTAMLTFLDYWNLVDQAVIFIQDVEKQPLSIFLAQINNSNTDLAFAGSCFYAVPMLLVLLYGQEQLKQGITVAGIKG